MRKKKQKRERLKKHVKGAGSTYAVSNNYSHSDDQSIKNMISQGKYFQKENFETWGRLSSHEYP